MNQDQSSIQKKKPLGGAAVFYYGEPMVWLTGSALAMCVLMIAGFLLYILWMGMSTFWPSDLQEFELKNNEVIAGEIHNTESYRVTKDTFSHLDADLQAEVTGLVTASGESSSERTLLRSCNYELAGSHFIWIDNHLIKERRQPEWLMFMERLTKKPFVGYPVSLFIEGKEQTWRALHEILPDIHRRYNQRRHLEKHVLGDLREKESDARMYTIAEKLSYGEDSEEYAQAIAHYETIQESVKIQTVAVLEEINLLKSENAKYQIALRTAGGIDTKIDCEEIVRVYVPNQIGVLAKFSIYVSRWYEFLTDDPRQANSQGGIWPALFGTVLMTILMTVFVMPFGVIAALYMREYAKKGPLLTTVRISINNLAGVPSIVFGVFGLGFFCYIIGDMVDNTFYPAYVHEALPVFKKGGIMWASCTMALLTLPVVIVATEEALSAVPNSMREGSYGCGASKWQTIRRIVLPRSLPGILTGMILAMARGAGEVAPLMLVGAVKMAAELPTDPSASFMHLGFHIYDLSYHSQDSEAAKPMVFTTTLLLIVMVASLNIVAIYLRNRLNKRFNIQTF